MLIDNADSLLKSYLQVFIVAEHLIPYVCLFPQHLSFAMPFSQKNPLSGVSAGQGIHFYLKN